MADSLVKFARGDVISRKYEIEKSLGDGIFGSTYLARHIASGRHVVVKFLQPAALAGADPAGRLKAGFDKAKAVRHPCLIRYGEINQHGDQYYITEEYFEGENLREVIDHHVSAAEPFTLQDACQIVIKVLEALQEAHDNGLVHRDVKPENILVQTQRSGPGGSRLVRTIKLTDLGVPDMVSSEVLGDRYDGNYDISYMAPELLSLAQEGSARADIFSVGVILYELLCGQPPKGTFFSPTQVRDDLPDHVDHLVELALSPEPTDRYPTAKDMILDIQRSFNLEMQTGKPATNIRSVMLGLGAALVLTLIAGLYFGFGEATDPQAEAQKRDDIIRRTVMQENPPVDESVFKAVSSTQPDMVFVPNGTFLQGRLNAEDNKVVSPAEPLARKVEVEGYFIDRFEFPNRPGELPTGNVSFDEAQKTCETVGKRLCTAVEWEKACKGLPNFIYAYGDTYDPSICGQSMNAEYKLGDRKQCVSAYGVYGLSGGFREWTASGPPNKPGRRIVKGGSRGSAEKGSRCAFSTDEDINYAESTMTFRCCKDVE